MVHGKKCVKGPWVGSKTKEGIFVGIHYGKKCVKGRWVGSKTEEGIFVGIHIVM